MSAHSRVNNIIQNADQHFTVRSVTDAGTSPASAVCCFPKNDS